MIIYVDIDGVLADFITGAAHTHKMPSPYINKNNLGKRDIAAMLKIKPDKFWSILNTREFWESLSPLLDGFKMLVFLEEQFGIDNIRLLTAPTPSPECYAGKFAWVENHLPEYKRQLIISPDKRAAAQDDGILIDDSEENISKFGPRGILYPDVSNHLHDKIPIRSEYIGDRLAEIIYD